jgi:hypothetical protein
MAGTISILDNAPRLVITKTGEISVALAATQGPAGPGTAPEGTAIKSTGETGGSKFLREDGDGTCSWQEITAVGDLLSSNNLSDVASASTSRQNLGLGTAAVAASSDFAPALGVDDNYVTDAEKVVIGNTSGTNTGDQDLSGLAVKANNLSDLASASAARTNLGLGTAATSASTDFAAALGVDDNYVTDAEKVVIGNTSGTNTGDQDLSALATKANVLERDNTDVFTPTTDYHPATKKYVDDNAGGSGDLLAANNLSDLANAATARTNLGLGTAATSASTDFAPALGADDNYVTDAEKVVIGNTSGTNTGDQDLSGLAVKANNLSDLASASAARTNLGLGTAATSASTDFAPALGADDNYVTDAEKVVIGNTSGTNTGDQDLSGLAVKANNLSDLTSAATARTNLGLGTAATSASTDFAPALGADDNYVTDAEKVVIGNTSGTNTGDQDLSGLAVKANNLSDLVSASAARTNLGLGTAATSASTDFASATAPFWVEVVLTAAGADIATGIKVGLLTHTVAGTITDFKIVCDPANEPSAAAVQVDMNSLDLSTGAATSRLSAVASIATSANVSTGGTISGTQTVAFGDQTSFDIDQGSDGKELRGLVQITPSS